MVSSSSHEAGWSQSVHCICRCAFRNCQHLEEPGCAVREGWARHAWYAELHEEVKAADELARHRAASKKRREGSVRCGPFPVQPVAGMRSLSGALLSQALL